MAEAEEDAEINEFYQNVTFHFHTILYLTLIYGYVPYPVQRPVPPSLCNDTGYFTAYSLPCNDI